MSTDNIDTSNIQGDIITGIPKKAQIFFFFQIANVPAFKAALARFTPSIATESAVAQAQKDIAAHKASQQSGLLSLSYTTIAFSQKGLTQLGITENIGDSPFAGGQLADSSNLGDSGTGSGTTFEPDNWLFPFKHDIHGVFSVAASSTALVQAELTVICMKFKTAIREVYRIAGNVRPGSEEGHEHFGFLDGVSNPAIRGLSTPPDSNGSVEDGSVDPGVMLLGRQGDAVTGRPTWALDGSFLVYRQLKQLVPEFNRFLANNALQTGDPTVSGADLLGARLMGRWKSGAPIQLAPLKDNPALAADPTSRNNFVFDQTSKSQELCPFAAHIRKTNPRNDLRNVEPNRIIRRGIPYGPEVTASELAHKSTENDRGLLFVSYQSNITNGFQLLQRFWANEPDFISGKGVKPGFDPIIGQNHGTKDNEGARTLIGTDPANTDSSLGLAQEFVVPEGGEYFFTPSISALKTKFTAASS